MRGYAAIGLFMPQNNINVSAVMRAAGVFDAKFVAIMGKKYEPKQTDTMKVHRRIPVIQCSDLFDIVPYGCVPVAIELIDGARDLTHYTHPERAFYIFGPENSTLGKKTTDRCRDIVRIPTNGCMNLAATANVVLYDRMAKQCG